MSVYDRLASLNASALNHRQWAVATALVRYADDRTGECWPAVATLARACKLSVRTVRQALGELREMQVVQVVQPSRGARPNRYRLCTDRAPQPADDPADPPPPPDPGAPAPIPAPAIDDQTTAHRHGDDAHRHGDAAHRHGEHAHRHGGAAHRHGAAASPGAACTQTIQQPSSNHHQPPSPAAGPNGPGGAFAPAPPRACGSPDAPGPRARAFGGHGRHGVDGVDGGGGAVRDGGGGGGGFEGDLARSVKALRSLGVHGAEALARRAGSERVVRWAYERARGKGVKNPAALAAGLLRRG